MTTVAPLTDFSDRLSPMVVKELRQGLRTRLFGGVMLVLHTLLVLITLMAGASTGGNEARGLMDGLITLVLCGIFPLCGFSALAGEIQANTMDMLVLTRLSTWRIVFGKWAAIIIQSLLVTVSVIPYFVARYVFGGAELMTDFISLFHQWLISIVLTAGVVALSTQKHFWLRMLILGLPLMLIMFGSFARFIASAMGGAGWVVGVKYAWLGNLSFVAFCAWLIFALLSFGASRIAPASSLLPVTKRLVHLGALIFLSFLSWLMDANTVGETMIIVLTVASLDALMDDVNNIPALYTPFYRRGWVGRGLSWLLAPGWMHGFLYTLFLAILCVAVMLGFQAWKEAVIIWLLSCALWQAAFWGHMLAIRRSRDYLGAIFAGICIEVWFSVLISMIVGFSKQKAELEWLYCLMPWNTSFHLSDMRFMTPSFEMGLVINSLWPFLLVIPAWLVFRRTQSARAQARQLVLSPHD